MSYSDFKSLNLTLSAFGLSLHNQANLFADTQPVQPSPFLQETLKRRQRLAQNIGTEKAKSEFIIAPILSEIYDAFDGEISLFSGNTLSVDPLSGLNGECDFILSASPNQLEISSPVLTIVEAKDDDIKAGLGQCAAQMVGAYRFNDQQHKLLPIYGAVSTGTIWKFMRLTDSQLEVDLTEYLVPPELEMVLGILTRSLLPASLAPKNQPLGDSKHHQIRQLRT